MKPLKAPLFLLCLFLFSTLTAQKLVDDDIIGNYFGTTVYSRFKRTIIETEHHLIVGKDHKIKRYDKTGELDESFGENGLLSLGDSVLEIKGLFLSEEHLVIIAILRSDGTQSKLKYFLYDKNGKELQLSQLNEIAESYTLYDVLLLKDKKILLIGSSRNINTGASDYLAIRLTNKGTVDDTFQLQFPSSENYDKNFANVFMAVSQRKDGKLIIAELGNCETNLRRYTLDGTIDTSFGKEGKALVPYDFAPYIQDIHFVEDKILVAGHLGSFYMARFSESGELDTTFAEEGIASHFQENDPKDESLHSSIIGPDGKILLLGNSEIPNVNWEYRQALLVRYNADGSLDKTFMNNGAFYLEGFKSSDFLYAKSIAEGYQLLFSESFNEIGRAIGSLYTMDLKTEISTGISEQKNNITYQVYPNPVSEILTLTYQLEKAEKAKITLLTINGKVLKNLLFELQPAGTHTQIFNLRNFTKGVYYLRLVTSNGEGITKIIIQ